MPSTLLLALLLIQPSVGCTDTDTIRISEGLIAQHTVYFEIRDNKFAGAAPLTAALSEARFVALGELHNRTRSGELTEALLHLLKLQGFDKFAVETGPYSARKLQELVRSGKPSVSEFYARYASRFFGFVPVPFFEGESDLRFLAAADSIGYELWGLDQEYYFSYAFLIDELALLAGENLTDQQAQLRRELARRLYRLNRRNQMTGGFELSCRMLNDDRLEAYLQSFEDASHPDIRMITEAFRTTLEIYCLDEQGRGNMSNPIRTGYFKENFDRNYAAAIAENPESKVFLKMGSYHLGRQRSPLNLYDIGNHIQQLAASTGHATVHISYLNRYLDGKDMKGRKGWENSEQLISAGDLEKWALTDLRPLREQLMNGTLRGNDFEIRAILNYDFIIIPPQDHRVKRHW